MSERLDYIPGLLTGTGWDIMDTAAFQYYDAVFQRDFGPIKKGDAFSTVMVDYQNQIIACYQASKEIAGEENEVHRLKFQLDFVESVPFVSNES